MNIQINNIYSTNSLSVIKVLSRIKKYDVVVIGSDIYEKPLQDMDYYMKYVCWDSIVTRYLEELIYPNISE